MHPLLCESSECLPQRVGQRDHGGLARVKAARSRGLLRGALGGALAGGMVHDVAEEAPAVLRVCRGVHGVRVPDPVQLAGGPCTAGRARLHHDQQEAAVEEAEEAEQSTRGRISDRKVLRLHCDHLPAVHLHLATAVVTHGPHHAPVAVVLPRLHEARDLHGPALLRITRRRGHRGTRAGDCVPKGPWVTERSETGVLQGRQAIYEADRSTHKGIGLQATKSTIRYRTWLREAPGLCRSRHPCRQQRPNHVSLQLGNGVAVVPLRVQEVREPAKPGLGRGTLDGANGRARPCTV
mmetsp:Transcript_22329/g.70033  ORF Transcript_22329/g.70033 Transcript_22329/m.70033 type:complete len:294 (+) Transcript_22329:1071-1952(+)